MEDHCVELEDFLIVGDVGLGMCDCCGDSFVAGQGSVDEQNEQYI